MFTVDKISFKRLTANTKNTNIVSLSVSFESGFSRFKDYLKLMSLSWKFHTETVEENFQQMQIFF